MNHHHVPPRGHRRQVGRAVDEARAAAVSRQHRLFPEVARPMGQRAGGGEPPGSGPGSGRGSRARHLERHPLHTADLCADGSPRVDHDGRCGHRPPGAVQRGRPRRLPDSTSRAVPDAVRRRPRATVASRWAQSRQLLTGRLACVRRILGPDIAGRGRFSRGRPGPSPFGRRVGRKRVAVLVVACALSSGRSRRD